MLKALLGDGEVSDSGKPGKSQLECRDRGIFAYEGGLFMGIILFSYITVVKLFFWV